MLLLDLPSDILIDLLSVCELNDVLRIEQVNWILPRPNFFSYLTHSLLGMPSAPRSSIDPASLVSASSSP